MLKVSFFVELRTDFTQNCGALNSQKITPKKRWSFRFSMLSLLGKKTIFVVYVMSSGGQVDPRWSLETHFELFWSLVAKWLPDGLWRLILSCSGLWWPSGSQLISGCSFWAVLDTGALQVKSSTTLGSLNQKLHDFGLFKSKAPRLWAL